MSLPWLSEPKQSLIEAPNASTPPSSSSFAEALGQLKVSASQQTIVSCVF
jgi:hypothetical protein